MCCEQGQLFKSDIRNLTELNNITYAAVAYATELVRANKLPKTKKEPLRKRRLEGKLKEFSRDLDLVSSLLEKIRRKRVNIVREEMT